MSISSSEVRSLFSAIRELYKTGSALEAEQELLTLEKAFLDIQLANLDLRLELRAMQESLQERDTMLYEAPFYFLVDGEKRSGPFCQRCYDSDGKKIHLIEHSFREGSHRCNVCASYYGPPREEADVHQFALHSALQKSRKPAKM